jgi:peptidoglycan hydrolase CwlO-like protein
MNGELIGILGVGATLLIALVSATTLIISNANTAHKAIGENIGRVEGKVDNLEGKVDNLDGKIDKLDGKIDKLESKVDGLAKDVSELKVDVAVLNTDMGWIKKKLSGPEG